MTALHGRDRAEEQPYYRARHRADRCAWCPARPISSSAAAQRAIGSPSSPARCGGRSSWCSTLAGLRQHFAEVVAAEDVSACKPDPQGYQPRARSAGAGAGPVRGDRGLAARAGRRARRRDALRHAHHLARRGRSAPARDLVWRDFVGHDRRRASLGPCLTLRSDLRPRPARRGCATGRSWSSTDPAVFRVDGTGRAHLPPGTAHQRSRQAGRREPGLWRAAHAQGHDRDRLLGRCASGDGSRCRAARGPRRRARAFRRSCRPGSPGWPICTDEATVAWLLGDHGFQRLAKSGIGAPGGAGRVPRWAAR